MKLHVLAAVAAVFAFAAPIAAAQEQAAPELPATPQAWRAAAESDLEALRMYLREDTPVAVDTENPRMQRWFDRGYRDARQRVRRVTDQPSYFYALAAYANGFQDPHLSLSPVAPISTARWPGFITTSRGEDTIVASTAGCHCRGGAHYQLRWPCAGAFARADGVSVHTEPAAGP